MLKKNLDDLKLENRFTYKKRNVFYASDILIPGSRFQIVYFDPNSGIEPHYHLVATEIYQITQGNGAIVINGKRENVKAGSCFIIHPKDVHEIYAGKKGLTISIFKYNESIEDIFWVKG